MDRKKRIWLLLAALSATILLSGCVRNTCGDGICRSWEEFRGSCPQDCVPETGGPGGAIPAETPLPAQVVKNITVLVDVVGGRVDWSHKHNLITFSKTATDGYFDVYTMTPDGTNQVCLTCDKPELPQQNNGQPAWHPSGEYIVFQAQDPGLYLPESSQYSAAYLTQGGAGFNNNLWVMDQDGTEFYQITRIKSGEAILHAHFSHDGSQLFWTARERGIAGGQWMLKIADFVMDDSGPHIENEASYRPRGESDTFYESHGFTLDDEMIIFSADIGRDETYDMDIWLMDLETQELTQLTDSIYTWDEHGQISPNGEKVVWISSQDHDWPSSGHWGLMLKTDLWIMDIDGSNKQRLTYFNEPGYPEYNPQERIIAADSSWNADGTMIVVTLGVMEGAGSKCRRIVLIELDG